jgi:hypothetical protein
MRVPTGPTDLTGEEPSAFATPERSRDRVALFGEEGDLSTE